MKAELTEKVTVSVELVFDTEWFRTKGQRDCNECGSQIENGARCLHISDDHEVICEPCGEAYLGYQL